VNYPSIRIEGAILSPDILEKLEDAPGQRPVDFGFESSVKVKDEILRAWADAQDYWRIFQRKLDSLKSDSPATTETRNLWVVPLLGLLSYQLDYQSRGTELNDKNYPISHRVANRGYTAFHIVGYRESAGLDRKPEKMTVRMSAHGLVQEYLNLSDQLYGLVTNGRLLRLLRDSSRLVKLSYLEFDLDRIFSDGLFADFAILFRLLHASRLPAAQQAAETSIIERYHQDSLESGARIRDGLSRAVEEAILAFANGFLAHPANDLLRDTIASGELKPIIFYQYLLRLIYRILFLLVIEERDLVYPLAPSTTKRDVYYRYYSLQRLRRLSEKRYLADRRQKDLWLALLSCFRLFESDGPGDRLGIAPLGGDLFSADAVGPITKCSLSNDILLGCLRSLGVYKNPDTEQVIRVNYAALNVEELGSVYEGLLKYEPVFDASSEHTRFALNPGSDDTQSHYTADDLVQPLLKHSLDHLITEKLKDADPEKALLSLRVADISCGSGHILLAAARRIATELAVVRTGEEQPSPVAFRTAVRDVIRECIYGVDVNPLAVELCKVALWLEAHNPGEPLNFLDHHIKCGNAIVGFVRRDELERGVPDEAFVTMPGDEKEVAASFRKRNKADRTAKNQTQINLAPEIQKHLEEILRKWREVSALPERTPHEIESKKRRYLDFTRTQDAWILSQVASIPIAQFYVQKTKENQPKIITDAEFRLYLAGQRHPQGQATAKAWSTAFEKRFFHWFIEFPDVIARGGFDCILGNPPYLGGQDLSGTYGHSFCGYVKWEYAPAGLSDLVAYFVRRIFELLKPGGFTAFITTNSIKDGDIRKDGLEQILAQGGQINMAVRGIKWPGRANVVVSLVALHKGKWSGKRTLDGRDVLTINAYFEDSADGGDPVDLPENAGKVFQGSIFLGDGFILTHEEAARLIAADPRNRDVVFSAPRGKEDINNAPDQAPGRSIINFHDWNESRARAYPIPFQIVEDKVKPERLGQGDVKGREFWWRFLRPRMEMANAIRHLSNCFVSARTTKYLNFSPLPADYVFTDSLNVFTTDRWDLFAVVQSTLHEVWARKYSGALKQDLRYSPSKCFDTFAFPEGLWQTANPALAAIGERYHEHRKSLMLLLWLGLTDIYNLFHARDLSVVRVAKVSKKPEVEAERGCQGIIELRRLHVELDLAIRDAYGWQDLDLAHDFVEVETLAENDRVRYTISPAARKELLERLLQLNHQRAALAANVTLQNKSRANSTGKKQDEHQPLLTREGE
jgi:methylase of polypeptide subunit release factors